MRYDIWLSPGAVRELRALRAYDRAKLRTALEEHLRAEPMRVSRSRIKKLRGLRRPRYRLRVDDMRVFYDVIENRVEILAIVSKEEALRWLEAHGQRET